METVQVQEESSSDSAPHLSQRDFVPTPFAQSDWEVVGERIPDLGFQPMTVDFLPSEMTRPDPMFWDFGGTAHAEDGKVSHAGQAIEQKSEAPVIDEAVLEQVRQEAFEAGRQAGLTEGREAVDSESRERHLELAKELAAFQENIVSELKKVALRAEKNALDLALAVAKKILLTTADVRADYILEVIRSALAATGAGTPLRIRVSPQDFEFLQVIGLPPELSSEETGVQYLADDTISSGCVMETDFGEIDLRLDHMWQQVRENLYDVVK